MRATYRTGPVGIGTYLVGHRGSWSDPKDAEVWFLFLFLPVVPLSVWRVSASGDTADGTNGETLELAVHSRGAVSPGAALRRILRGAGIAVLAVLPLGFAVSQIGTPWAEPLLTVALGSILSGGVIGKMSMAVELAVPLLGAAIPLLVLMHLDERIPRLPFLAALGFRR